MAKKKGRKSFKATNTLKRKVEQLTFCGMSQDDIARAIGCSTPTLLKHFAEELATGAAKKQAEVFDMMWKSAKGGNVAAQKRLEELGRLAAASAGVGTPPKATTSKIGKKQLEAAAAESAGGEGTEWGDLLTTRPN